MKALVTGASSGIGKEIAIYLSELGYDLILVSRSKEKLEEVQKLVKTKAQVVVMDLSDEQKVKELYVMYKNEKIDFLVNNAGFGVCDEFTKTNLNDEIEMINLNVKAVHMLTKFFLKDMIERDSGYILNVASSAALIPGPLMATYYATKAYVYRLTESIYGELKHKKSNVHISVLCPGPVDTNFNNVAKVKFSLKGLDAMFVARYGIDKTLKKKLIIIPGFKIKLANFFRRFFTEKFLAKFNYGIQKKKKSN